MSLTNVTSKNKSPTIKGAKRMIVPVTKHELKQFNDGDEEDAGTALKTVPTL